MFKLLRNKKLLQVMKRPAAWVAAFLLLLHMPLNLQATSQQDEAVEWNPIAAYAEIATFNTNILHWAAEDQVVPMGQNYVDLTFEWEWADSTPFPVTSVILSLSFTPGAFALESASLEEGAGTLIAADPMHIPTDPPREAQSFQITGMGFPGPGYEGPIVIRARFNIGNNVLVNEGDSYEISVLRAAMPGLPSNMTHVTVTRGPALFDIRYHENAHEGGLVSNMPADQLGLEAGTHLVCTQMPYHTNLNRDGQPTRVMFVGWSTTPTTQIFAAGERDQLPTGWINPREANASVTITDADVNLYAIWGWSSDGEGPPDVLRDTYSIYYHPNPQGGTVGNMPPTRVNLLPGNYGLGDIVPTHSNVVRDGESTVVLFVGWSAAPQNRIFAAGERDQLPELLTEVTIINASVTVHAVWGWSTDGDGPPDVLRDAFTIYYRPNPQDGGTVSDMPADRVNLLAGTYGLGAAVPLHSDVSRDGVDTTVLFVGWSATPQNRIFAAGERDQLPELLTEVTITDASVAVYAVWGWSTDGEGPPDVLRDAFSIYYRPNPQGGIVSHMPTTRVNLLAGVHGLSDTVPLHSNVIRNGEATAVLFVGWSATPENHIFAAGERDQLPDLLDEVTIINASVAVYAVWGWSTDGDGPPDVLRDVFTIYYRGNPQQGGTVEELPASQVNLLPGIHPIRTEMPTHINLYRGGESTAVLFVGWSRTPVEQIFGAGELNQLPAGWINPRVAGASVIIIDADVPLYAIWGWSTDGEGPPDVLRDTFDILYRANAQQGGTVTAMPANQLNLLPGPHPIRTEMPNHTDVVYGGKAITVLFVGWSTTPTDRIFGAGEYNQLPAGWINPRVAGASVTITNADVPLYAIWGWSLDGEGPPDVLRDAFDILYHGNAQQGGLVTGVPTNQLNLLAGTHPIRTGMPNHTNLNRDGESTAVLFVGWSRAPIDHIFGAGEADQLPEGWINPRVENASVTIVDANVSLYAIWGWSTDGEGPPDVLRDSFNILYHGNAQGDGTVSDLPANQLNLMPGTHPVRSQMPFHTNLNRDGESTAVLFVGWSRAPVDHIFGAGEAGELPEGWINPRVANASVTIVDADVPLYAIWGWSTDGEGPPDVLRDVFSIYYQGNAQGGTVAGLPATQVNRLPGVHGLGDVTPTHTPVVRGEVLTNVVFLGWSDAPTTQIFGEGATLPTLLTNVTITNANITVYAVWGWGSCVDCNECPGCDDCFDCGDVDPCDCGSGYCEDCCDECCDCDFECKDCGECCDVEPCDCGSGYCEDCCDECCDCDFE